MSPERPYWNMEIEPLLNTPVMQEIQLSKLKKMLGRLKVNAPFYKKMIEESKLDPEKLSGFEEFRDKITLFNKEALKALVMECGGDFLKALDQIMPVNVGELDWMGTTTGTTGLPTPYPLTNFDVKNLWGGSHGPGAWRAGVRPHDRMLWCFALSMVIAGVPTMMGMQKLGCMMLPVGAEAKSERILTMQGLFRGTVYVGTPSLAEYLIEQAPKILKKEAEHLGFNFLFCGGEPGAGIPEVKKKLENAFGCRLFDAGAGFGCSCDYPEYQGMHWLGDDLAYYELVDPETKAPIPLEDGAKGEAVFTTLEGDGMVFVRQSLGDIHQVSMDPCPCGRSGFRYRVVGRSDDMLKVKGVMVYPSHLKGVINEFVPRVTGEMRIVLDKKPPRVVPPLKLRVEHARGLSGEELTRLENEIIEAMSRRLKISPRILWAEPGKPGAEHLQRTGLRKTLRATGETIMRDVYVAGIGMTRVNKYMDRSIKYLAGVALDACLSDAGIGKKDLEAIWFSNSAWGYFQNQQCIRGQVALREAGIEGVPITNVENACAGGATAFHHGWLGVASGLYECVLAIGAEKLYDQDRQKMFGAFWTGVDVENISGLMADWKNVLSEVKLDIPVSEDSEGAGKNRSAFMDIYAGMCRWHMATYGTTQRQLAVIASKNHFHSSMNPYAQFQNEMSVEEILGAKPVTYPFTVPMCAPLGDGAAAAILCSADFLKRLKSPRPVKVLASVLGSGTSRDIAEEDQDIAARLSRSAYSIAGIGPQEIDLAEVHDATAFGELHQAESLGFCPKGEGGLFTESGATRLGGKIPINTSGGLESRGHPIGASGLGQINEIVTQLRHEAGSRQVAGCRVGLAENGGGNMGFEEAAMGIHILERISR